ncbi:MAG: acyloxyacyl hydrolase [Alphaproteobacteria bacterium]|nr:acyloxyacyl hydrolase [Alphaproteobacteria bacterium]
MTGSKTLRNVLLATAAMVISTSAASAANLMVSVNGGGSFTQFEAKDGYTESVGNGMVTGLSLGYAFSDRFSVELTGGYRFGYDYKGSNNNASTNPTAPFPAGVETKSKVSSFSVIPALRYAFPVSAVKLYGLAGVGMAWNTTSESKISYSKDTSAITGEFADKTSSGLAYTAGVGVSYDATEQLVIDLGYRFTDLGEFQGGEGTATGTFGPLSQTFAVPAPDARHPVSHEIALTIGYRF